ncbi:hypothetical protein K493DRAFT_342174 [Basidiobolus meristosporus CBS 931.73]|uniref:Uncharacterized protein n=1 Tax=Basidiobolus meristosporus CBS 931.73 TaxID=1314790 RepID=A0A1Y1XB12_9FUNG|nr:hypothetical protein K493DRAFT_342174 [Basidiobolus meristosporus CBS 931.73]|eukprot:ORX82626.1 hypothetical protein K493DRAFT_342174 [Basidiobolus meristosporus CBS 931.73]
MGHEHDPHQVPLSRMLSDYSVEEDRPGFFNLSYADDIHTSIDYYASQHFQGNGSSSSSKSPTPTTCSGKATLATPYLKPEKNHMTHSTNPMVTVTDWTDPLRASDEQKPKPETSDEIDNKEAARALNSNAEQNLEEGKPPVFLDSQASNLQPSEANPRDAFVRKLSSFIKKNIRDPMTPKAFRSFAHTAEWIGPVDILTCSGLIFFPPNKTLGAQLEASVLGVIFIMISGAYNYAGLACLAAYNSRENPQAYGAPLITAAFIIFSSLLLGYLRTKYTRLYTPCVAAQITLFFALFLNMRRGNLPAKCDGETGAVTFSDETQNALKLTNELLQEVVKTYLFVGNDARPPEDLETTRLLLRNSLGTLNSVGREAMYELSVDRFAPWDYKWIGSTITTVGQILGSMLLLVCKEYSVLPRDPDVAPPGPLHRNETLIVQIKRNRDFSISDSQIYMALLNTVRDPVTRITEVCSRAVKHIQSQLKIKKPRPQPPSSASSLSEQANQANVNIPLVDNYESSKIIEELEQAIAEFETTEALCSQVLREMGLDTKPRDELFMVFTFLFCTREVARKLLKLAKFQKELCKLRVKARRIWWPAVGIYTLLSAPRYDDLIQVPEKDLDLTDQEDPNPPENGRIHQHFRYRLWLFLMWFQKPEFKFSVKFTLALCLTAIPAFVSGTYDWFIQVHGNWGLVTVCVVMNQTVGATISIGIYRIIGTILGGLWGYLGWLASKGNPYIILVFTYIIAIPCWFFFITKPQTKIHSVSLITYMVIIFSMYNAAVIQKEEITSSALLLAVLRTANLIAAIVISLLVEMLLWPTFYSLGVLFSRIISVYMMEKDSSAMLEAKYDIKRLTSKLQSSITKATALLAPSAQEPRLRDDFQEQTYVDIITKVQNLLDWSSTMRTSILQIEDRLRVMLANRLVKRRKDVVAAVLLHFYCISGAFKSKSPLPPYLPSARVARLRLLSKIRKVSIFQNLGNKSLHSDNDADDGFVFTYWYSYAGSLIEIVEEQEELGDLVKQIVGEIEFLMCDVSPNTDRTPTTSIDIERMADAAGLLVPKAAR